tara:strand:+ start:5696 stop:5926 length:231 start_codon:yes stop_codon:yes gene_type:complete
LPRTRIEKRAKRSWDATTIEKLREMYASGVLTEVIAEWFGVSVNAIRQQASKNNIYRTAEHLTKVHREAKIRKRWR